MAALSGYNYFDGRHWETGTAHNFMGYCGYTLPHNGRPPGEALLMGISGGAVMGYFSFAYEGYDPQANILTRNTFDPMETFLSRLGVEQMIKHTGNPERAQETLLQTLQEGSPAIVWADPFSLVYNHLPQDEGMWGMMPILVFAADEQSNTVSIADRASVPLAIPLDALKRARGRVKKTRHRLLTLGPPNPARLASAMSAGIHDCLRLYLEKPPKGAAHNFGFAAYRHWAKLLTGPGARGSWAKEFPPGDKMLAGLTSAYSFINHFGKDYDDPAERNLFAAFLDEAATILSKPALAQAAGHFRQSSKAWQALSHALLPDEISLLRETRKLMDRRHCLFLEQGNAALPQIQEADRRLSKLRREAASAFPLGENGVIALRQHLADCVMRVHDVEQEAVSAMQEAMSA